MAANRIKEYLPIQFQSQQSVNDIEILVLSITML